MLRRVCWQTAADHFGQEARHAFRMRSCAFLQLLDEFRVELARKRHESLRLVELALFAAIEQGCSGGAFAEAVGGRQLHGIGQFEGLVLLKVGFFHRHSESLSRVGNPALYASALACQPDTGSSGVERRGSAQARSSAMLSINARMRCQ